MEFAQLLTNEENQMKFAQLTTVLPVNKNTLENEYFTKLTNDDPNTIARITSAKQLKKALPPIKYKDIKGLSNIVNKIIAEILLDKTNTKKGLNEIQNRLLKDN